MTRLSSSAFAVALVVLLATSFLCSNVEAIRGKGSSGDQCLEEDQYLNDEEIFSDEARPSTNLLTPPFASPAQTGVRSQLPTQYASPRPSSAHLSPRPLVYQAPTSVYSPRPSSAYPSTRGSGAPTSPHPRSYVPSNTHVSYPSGAAAPLTTTQGSRTEGTRYASVYLVDEAGHPTGQFVVVLINRNGQILGIPTFQVAASSPTLSAADGPPPQTGLIEHNIHTVVPHAPHEEHSRGATLVHGAEKVVVAADIAATGVATYQVGHAFQTGGTTAGNAAIMGAHPHPVPLLGHELQHAHLIGHGAGATGALAGTSAALSIFAVAANGYQCKVSHGNMVTAAEWRDEIRRGSGPMTHEEYDEKVEQTDAFIEHERKTFALSATAGTGAAVSGVLGGFIAAGTAPAWAPPVVLGVCIGTAGVGIVQLGRWAFVPKPELPDPGDNWNPAETETDSESDDSLLELSQAKVSKPLGFASGGASVGSLDHNVMDTGIVDASAFSDREKQPKLGVTGALLRNQSRHMSTATAVGEAFLENIFLPRWSSMYGQKFALMPFYIDLLFRNLRKHFGAQVHYIQTVTTVDGTAEMLGNWADQSWNREKLTWVCQNFDDPYHLAFEVNTQHGEFGPRGRSLIMPKAENFKHFDSLGLRPTYSAYMPRARATAESDDNCDDKGPTPDSYCEEKFGMGNKTCCQKRIVNNAFPHLAGHGVCGECPDYRIKSQQENYAHSGVRAVLDEETVTLSISNVDQFKRFTRATLANPSDFLEDA